MKTKEYKPSSFEHIPKIFPMSPKYFAQNHSASLDPVEIFQDKEIASLKQHKEIQYQKIFTASNRKRR